MFEDLFNFVTTIVTENIGAMVVLFADVITPLIGSLVVLYAIYLAYQMLFDAEKLMVMESLTFIGSLALCTTVAFNTSWYMSSIVPMVLHSGDTISSYLTSSTGGSGGALQETFKTMMVQIESLWDNVSFAVTASWGFISHGDLIGACYIGVCSVSSGCYRILTGSKSDGGVLTHSRSTVHYVCFFSINTKHVSVLDRSVLELRSTYYRIPSCFQYFQSNDQLCSWWQ